MAVARGDEPAELVLKGGRVFSVFTREWLRTDVAVEDGHVVGLGDYQGRRTTDLEGAYLVPGFIDAHVHVESSKLMFDEFARAVLPHGTTAVVADPHELANVLGSDGVHWMLEATGALPLEIFVMAPSCVPASALESPLRPLSTGDIASLLRRRRTIGIAEMMNFPAVIAGAPEEIAKLATGLTDHVDGHAPGVRGHDLNAYLAAGIGSDHESTTFEEALEKRRLGMWVMLREASAARNLADLLPLVKRYGPERCMLCTDDREPDFIVEQGHVNQMVRAAVSEGVSPEDAIVMATLNPADYHGLRRLGAIAPGRQADLLVLDDLREFKPRTVLKRGVEPVVAPIAVPEWVRNTVRIAPVTPASFRIPHEGRGRVRAIRLVPGQLLTEREEVPAAASGGELRADPGRDLVKIAVVERHHATGRVGLAFVRGSGLARGAFASTVAHDAHNIIVLGADDEDMAACVVRLAELGGGIVAAESGRIAAELALPIAGLMSDRPLEEVHRRVGELERVVAKLGVGLPSPFMALSFLALSVIPDLKVTDRGLVDVSSGRVVPVQA